MSNYNLVQALIAEGKVIINETVLTQNSLTGDVENVEYMKSVFYGYNAWMRDAVFAAYNAGQITLNERKEVFSCVKTHAISRVRAYRNITIQSTTVVKQEVVIDRVAELEAELAAVKASDDAKALKIKDLEVSLTVSEAKVNKYEAVLSRLTKRTVVIGNVVTKAYVEVAQRVGF